MYFQRNTHTSSIHTLVKEYSKLIDKHCTDKKNKWNTFFTSVSNDIRNNLLNALTRETKKFHSNTGHFVSLSKLYTLFSLSFAIDSIFFSPKYLIVVPNNNKSSVFNLIQIELIIRIFNLTYKPNRISLN